VANGMRYLRWGGDGEAVQPEKCSGVKTAWDDRTPPKNQNPTFQ